MVDVITPIMNLIIEAIIEINQTSVEVQQNIDSCHELSKLLVKIKTMLDSTSDIALLLSFESFNQFKDLVNEIHTLMNKFKGNGTLLLYKQDNKLQNINVRKANVVCFIEFDAKINHFMNELAQLDAIRTHTGISGASLLQEQSQSPIHTSYAMMKAVHCDCETETIEHLAAIESHVEAGFGLPYDITTIAGDHKEMMDYIKDQNPSSPISPSEIENEQLFQQVVNDKICDIVENSMSITRRDEATLPSDRCTEELLERIGGILGLGEFGDVYMMRHSDSGVYYAVKCINISQAERESVSYDDIAKEAKIISHLQHHNIVRLYGHFRGIANPDNYVLVMENVEGRTLDAYTHISEPYIGIDACIQWMKQVVNALIYLHSQRIIHRDLKPDNIMVVDNLTGSTTIKIFGFNMARLLPVGHLPARHYVGHHTYYSYEKTNCLPYDGRDDIWAVGCIFLELLLQQSLNNRRPGVLLYNELNKKFLDAILHECHSKDPLMSLWIKHCLYDYESRPSAVKLYVEMALSYDELIRYDQVAYVNKQLSADLSLLPVANKNLVSLTVSEVSVLLTNRGYPATLVNKFHECEINGRALLSIAKQRKKFEDYNIDITSIHVTKREIDNVLKVMLDFDGEGVPVSLLIRNTDNLSVSQLSSEQPPLALHENHTQLVSYYHISTRVSCGDKDALSSLTKSADVNNIMEAKAFLMGICYYGDGVAVDKGKALLLSNEVAPWLFGFADDMIHDEDKEIVWFLKGFIYHEGLTIIQDLSEAIRYYTLAANQGLSNAQNNLGHCYENGIGVDKNLSEAVRYYTFAADQGLAHAQYNLGGCYKYGDGVAKNLLEAIRYYTLAANQGLASAQCSLGLCYEHGDGVDKNMDEAIKYYTLAANRSLADAQCILAYCYKNGKSVEKNITQAFQYFTSAAEQGHPTAQVNLAYFYDNGIEVDKNSLEATRYYKLAADQGYAPAQYNLAICYVNGDGVDVNLSEAIRLYSLSANQGFAAAQYNLAKCYASGDGIDINLPEAIKYFTLAADQGYADAQYDLAKCYRDAIGVDINVSETIRYYTLAADQGHVVAQTNLGYRYQIGDGVDKDLAEAIRLYQLAADQGYARAQDNLGYCYKNGIGFDIDVSTAIQYYTLAAGQGYANAQCVLITCYMNVGIFESEISEAIRYCKVAADHGYAAAQYNLGYCYDNGIGVVKDVSTAMRYYTLASDQGLASAQYSLGECYSNGVGVDMDLPEAVKFYKLAADQGCAKAQCTIATCYEHGIGVDKNIENAIMYYTLAANQGYVLAQYNLAQCYENGIGVKKNLSEAIRYFTLAANEGLADAQCHLGWYYEKGIGVTYSIAEARRLYKLAADQEHADALAASERLGRYWFR